MEKDFYKNRLGYLYEFSVIKNEYGSGKIYNGIDIVPNNIKWQLNMDLSGIITIVVFCKEELIIENETGFVEYSIEGESDNTKWIIDSKSVIFNEVKDNLTKGYYTYVGGAKTVELRQKNYIENTNDKLLIRAQINNFYFHGLEFSTIGKTKIKDKFNVNIMGKDVEFKLKNNFKDIMIMLDKKHIKNALISYIEFNANKQENMFEFIDNISWFLCLINLNATFSPYLEIIKEDQVVYRRLTSKMINYDYSKNSIIDNFHINKGIKNIFENNYSQYMAQKDTLELNKVIHTLLKIDQESTIEFKLVFLILALEQLCTRFLLMNNFSKRNVRKYNIEEKILKVETILGFAESNIDGGELRKKVRNKIFHIGDIPMLTFDEKKDIFNKYYELVYRLLFRSLNYTGKYLGRETFEVRDV